MRLLTRGRNVFENVPSGDMATFDAHDADSVVIGWTRRNTLSIVQCATFLDFIRLALLRREVETGVACDKIIR